MWELLKTALPEWKLPLQEWEKQLMEEDRLKKEEQALVVSLVFPFSHATDLQHMSVKISRQNEECKYT